MSNMFEEIPVCQQSNIWKKGMRELETLGSLLCITDLTVQYLRFNEKSLKRQQWGKLAFRETCNLFIPEKHSH